MKREEASKCAHEIRDAMKGFGTDEGTLVAQLASRTNAQMQAIVQAYNNEVKRDLIKDIKDETSSDFENALVALVTDTTAYDASLLKRAMGGVGTNEALLTEILCTRSPEELKRICEVYQHDYKGNLHQELDGETSGRLEKIYKAVLAGNRSGDEKGLDRYVAALYEAGENKIGTDEAKFVAVLAGLTRPVVLKVAELYEKKYGKSLAAVIKSEFSGETENALLALVTPLGSYFARRLHTAMAEGAGTDEATLIRVIIGNRERCLRDINIAYHQQFGKTLKQALESEVSGNFRRVLNAVITNFAS